jgi:predicted DNA-binding transcriptional regulator AlpA
MDHDRLQVSSLRVQRLPAVHSGIGMGRPRTYKKIQEGGFPRPFGLGARAIGWAPQDIDACITARSYAQAEVNP